MIYFLVSVKLDIEVSENVSPNIFQTRQRKLQNALEEILFCVFTAKLFRSIFKGPLNLKVKIELAYLSSNVR